MESRFVFTEAAESQFLEVLDEPPVNIEWR